MKILQYFQKACGQKQESNDQFCLASWLLFITIDLVLQTWLDLIEAAFGWDHVLTSDLQWLVLSPPPPTYAPKYEVW